MTPGLTRAPRVISDIKAILDHLYMNSCGLIVRMRKDIYSKQDARRQDISMNNALFAFYIKESLERNTKYERQMRVRPRRLSAGGL